MEDRSAFGASGQDDRESLEGKLSELFLRFSTEDNRIKGFAGNWTFYRPDSDSEDGITSQFRCLRTYDIVSSGEGSELTRAVKFQTFNEFEPANGKAQKRLTDGIFESSYLRSSADLFFSNNTALSETERSEDYPDCVYWRSAALDSEHVMRIAPHLPPRPAGSEDLPQYPKWIANNGPAGVFAFEAFLMDGENRWSMGALYSLSDLSLLSHFCILEKAITIDPSKVIDFNKFQYRKPDPRLSRDPSSWLSGHEFRGEMTELIWDEDGEAMKLPPRPASFTPPSTHSNTHRLFTYEDGCYAYYPLKLPQLQADQAKQFGEGTKFEMGLLQKSSRGQPSFRRLTLRYSATGGAVSLTKEFYKAEGSFEFDRRASQSVRRSIGSKRAASSRSIDPGSHHFARSADHRAAKLREAFSLADSEVAKPGDASAMPRMNSGGRDTLDDIKHVGEMRDSTRNRT